MKGRSHADRCEPNPTEDISDSEHESDSEAVPTQASSLFTCPEDGCMKAYMTHNRLEQHLTYGKHEFKLEKMSLIDKAKVGYAERLESGAKENVTLPPRTSKDGSYQLSSKGWALHEAAKTRKRFSEKQKKFLKKKFLEGEQTGKKCTGEDVAKEMRYVRDEHGERLFCVEEFLRPQQIQSFFSRLSAKLKGASLSDEEADIEHQRETALSHDVLVSLSSGISHHPLRFSGKNICEMNDAQLAKLKVTELRSMATHFSVNVKGRKKADYIDAVRLFLSTCECKNK